MAFKLADRVRETTTTTGTGSVALGGAVTGYQTFSAGIGASNTTYYVIADQTGSNWEVGYGTLDGTAANLARTTVLASSNSGSLVNFTSGTKDVFCDYPANKSVYLDASGNVSSLGTITSGVWNGSTIPVANGGTGQATANAGFNALAPSQTSNSGKYLTTNGTNTSWATVSGGVTGFTSGENTTAPNGTVYVDYLQASAASTDADVAIVPKGLGAFLGAVPDNTTTGGNKRGTNAIDLQTRRSASTQVASGNNSVLIGGWSNTASNNYSTQIGGSGNNVSGQYACQIGGSSNSAVGSYSAALNGNTNLANGVGSTVLGGTYGTTRFVRGIVVMPASDNFGNQAGCNQLSLLNLIAGTTDATPKVCTSNAGAAGTGNQMVLPDNSAFYFKVTVIAGVTGAGNTKGWTIEGVIKRGTGVGTTTLVGTPTVTSLYADAGAATWTVAATADTTNGALKITATGQASTTIGWVCNVQTTELAQ